MTASCWTTACRRIGGCSLSLRRPRYCPDSSRRRRAPPLALRPLCFVATQIEWLHCPQAVSAASAASLLLEVEGGAAAVAASPDGDWLRVHAWYADLTAGEQKRSCGALRTACSGTCRLRWRRSITPDPSGRPLASSTAQQPLFVRTVLDYRWTSSRCGLQGLQFLLGDTNRGEEQITEASAAAATVCQSTARGSGCGLSHAAPLLARCSFQCRSAGGSTTT